MSAYPPNLNTIVPNNISPKYVSETRSIYVDFKFLLDPYDSISAVTSITASVISGSDPSPASLLSGQPSIIGTQVTQMVTKGVAGTRYLVTVIVTTSLGSTLTGQVDFWAVPG